LDGLKGFRLATKPALAKYTLANEPIPALPYSKASVFGVFFYLTVQARVLMTIALSKGGRPMQKTRHYVDFYEIIEYFGNTQIRRTRKKGDGSVRRDWLNFDSIDEAMAYFNET
jgi:hypothetical protein